MSDAARAGLGVSMETFGELGMVFNDRTGQWVSGHQRYKRLLAAGAAECVRTGAEGYIEHPKTGPGMRIIARAVCRKVTRHLKQLTGEDKDQQLTLDNLANASVQGLVATGPRRGCRVLRLGGTGEDAEAAIISKRCADVAGFNVHANRHVAANDREGLEYLCRYLARPPIANDRLQELPDGRLSLRFKQAWRDGTTQIVFTPHELIEKLIPLVPRPRAHLVRYHGILGPAAKDRDKVVPTPPAPPAPNTTGTEVAGSDTDESRDIDTSKVPRLNRLPWSVLLQRVFMTDALTCPKCNGRMKILAAITEPEAIRKILDHLGIPSEAPRRAAARPPPQAEFPTSKLITIPTSLRATADMSRAKPGRASGVAPLLPLSSSTTTTCCSFHPMARASSAKPYCRFWLSRFSRTCLSDDCLMYTNAARSWCSGRILDRSRL